MLTACPPLELRLDARPELSATLRERLSDWLEAAGVTRKDAFEVTLATTEAFENAVRHPGRPGRGADQSRRHDGDHVAGPVAALTRRHSSSFRPERTGWKRLRVQPVQ